MSRLRKIVAWFVLHPRVKAGVQMLFSMVAVIGVVLTFYFHGQENSKIKAERVARQAAAVAQVQSSRTTAKAIRLVLCPLVLAYVHPSKGQNVPPQILAGWHAIGSLIGCS